MSDQQFNVKFVKCVEKHQVLYNFNLPGYSRKDFTERAWQLISREMNMPAAECKRKWMNLRTVCLRRLKSSAISESGKRRAYYLEKAMQFLVPYLKSVTPVVPKAERNIEPYCDTQDNEECNNFLVNDSSFEPPDSPMREVSALDGNEIGEELTYDTPTWPNIDDTAQKEEDPRRMFLLSLMDEFDDFSDSQFRKFKRQVLQLIDDVRLEKPSGCEAVLKNSTLSD